MMQGLQLRKWPSAAYAKLGELLRVRPAPTAPQKSTSRRTKNLYWRCGVCRRINGRPAYAHSL